MTKSLEIAKGGNIQTPTEIEVIDTKVTPLVMEWDKEAIEVNNDATWPSANTFLSDLVVWKVVSSEISVRDRYQRWPKVFQSVRMVYMIRLNMSPATSVRFQGKIKDVVFNQAYILYSDKGAQRVGGNDSHRTGAPTKAGVDDIGEKIADAEVPNAEVANAEHPFIDADKLKRLVLWRLDMKMAPSVGTETQKR